MYIYIYVNVFVHICTHLSMIYKYIYIYMYYDHIICKYMCIYIYIIIYTYVIYIYIYTQSAVYVPEWSPALHERFLWGFWPLSSKPFAGLATALISHDYLLNLPFSRLMPLVCSSGARAAGCYVQRLNVIVCFCKIFDTISWEPKREANYLTLEPGAAFRACSLPKLRLTFGEVYVVRDCQDRKHQLIWHSCLFLCKILWQDNLSLHCARKCCRWYLDPWISAWRVTCSSTTVWHLGTWV